MLAAAVTGCDSEPGLPATHLFLRCDMNEFQKWYNTLSPADAEHKSAERGWKAAINWANSKCRAHVTIHNNVYTDINKELMDLEDQT